MWQVPGSKWKLSGCLAGTARVKSGSLLRGNSISQVKEVSKAQINGKQSKKTKVGSGTIKREPGPACRTEWYLMVQDKDMSRVNPLLSNLCCWGELSGLQGPLRLNAYLPTKPGGPQGDRPCTLHISVPRIAE